MHKIKACNQQNSVLWRDWKIMERSLLQVTSSLRKDFCSHNFCARGMQRISFLYRVAFVGSCIMSDICGSVRFFKIQDRGVMYMLRYSLYCPCGAVVNVLHQLCGKFRYFQGFKTGNLTLFFSLKLTLSCLNPGHGGVVAVRWGGRG